MRDTRVVALSICSLVLAACAPIHSRSSMTAEVLKPICSPDETRGLILAGCAQGRTDLEKVHDLVQDSEQKCAEFVVGMFASNAKTNTYLDVATTSFTALATVFTPLNTVHALTAGGTITSGTKTSIQNNYLNALTLSHIVQAVQTSYSATMADYLNYLDARVEAKKEVDAYIERSTILAIHGLCSLPQAEGTIQATLAQGGANATPALAAATASLSFVFLPKPADVDAAALAADFAAALTADKAMKSAGVSAKPQGPASASLDILLDATKLAGVTWKSPQLSRDGKPSDAPAIAVFSADSKTLSFSAIPPAGTAITITADTVTAAKPAAPPAAPTATPASKPVPTKPRVLYGAPVARTKN